MSGLLDRLAGLFLEPAPPAEAVSTAEPVRWLPPVRPADPVGHPTRVAVICQARDGRLAGAAAALALAHVSRAGAAAVAEWSGLVPEAPADRPATPAARRAALALRDAGVTAGCCGRLVRVLLAAAESDAAGEARLVLARSQLPTVVVVAGARGAAFEALIGEQDLVLLVTRPGEDGELVTTASAELQGLGVPTRPVDLTPVPLAAALARSGTALVAPLRGQLLASLGAS